MSCSTMRTPISSGSPKMSVSSSRVNTTLPAPMKATVAIRSNSQSCLDLPFDAGEGHRCDEPPLCEQEADDEGHGGHHVAGHQQLELGAPGPLEGREPDLQRVVAVVADRNERPYQVVPRAQQR